MNYILAFLCGAVTVVIVGVLICVYLAVDFWRHGPLG